MVAIRIAMCPSAKPKDLEGLASNAKARLTEAWSALGLASRNSIW